MTRIRKQLAGLILAGIATGSLSARGAETVKPMGTGAAYDQIGKVAVMHEGRVKPFDTVAREEVKQVYSRETIALHDPREEVEKLLDPESFDKPGGTKWSVEKWGPVGAFLGWTVRPEFWDDQPFILVDYIPLRRLIVAGPLAARLKAIADKPSTSGDDKGRLEKFAGDRELVATRLIEFVRASKLPVEDRRSIVELAAKLTEEHKWLTPHELDEAKVEHKGETLPFLNLARKLGEQQRRFNENPKSAERPTEIERRVVEVAQRLMSYQAYSGDQFRTTGLILIVPRPSDAKYLAYTARSIAAYNEARAKGNEDLPLMRLDALKVLMTYWSFIPREAYEVRLMGSLNAASGIPTEGKYLVVVADVDHVLHFRIFDGSGKVVVDTDEKAMAERSQREIDHLKKQLQGLWPLHELSRAQKEGVVTAVSSLVGYTPDEHRKPTEDAEADERFTAWLRESSTWVPLKVLLKEKPAELAQAGYPEGALGAFLAAYHKLEQAETHEPGRVAEATAAEFLTASRSLGEAVSTEYPSVPTIERETYFNATNPFWTAPFAYGFAMMLLVVGLAFVSTTTRESWAGRLGRAVYRAGMLGLLGGIALEVWGFYFRVRITGWAPVTNMYETVIWVSLVAAVLSVVFEAIYGRVYFALAGSAFALLGTITAANVPLLDPSIKSLQPVLRSNLWLTIHVLTEVSSYAAFGLAWMLGLIATMFYLTATYRRSPRSGELALPLIPGLPLLTVGGAGVAASYGYFGPEWTTGDPLFYLFSAMGLLGGMVSLAAVLSICGEAVARFTFRDEAATEMDSEPSTWEPDQGATGRSVLGSSSDQGGGVATLVRPTVAEIRARAAASKVKLDARGMAMQRTAAIVKPLSNFIYRTMQVGVLLIAAGTILGGVWADYSWGRFWGWDAKEVWALITLLVYLIPLHGRFAGWVNTFGLVFASVFCFLSVVMAWYGVNFVLGVGLHSYGFVEGGSQGAMLMIIAGVLAFPVGAAWRRSLGYRPMFEDRPVAPGDGETSA